MPKSEASGNNSRVRVQPERKRRGKPDQNVESGHAAGREGLSHLPEALSRSDYSQRTFEHHAALLADPRMSRRMYTSQRTAIVMQLQRDYGNRYVQRLVKHIAQMRAETVQAKLTVGPAGDKYEQEADRVATQVMETVSSRGPEAAQRQAPEEAEVQMKPTAQRQEEEKLQMKPLAQRQEEESLSPIADNPQLYGPVEITYLTPPQYTRIAPPGTADLVVTFRNVHNWLKRDPKPYFKAMYDALKPGGFLGVVEHRAKPGTSLEKMITSGYMTEAKVIELVEGAGFQLVEKSEVNVNPKDTADHPRGVWTLPPSLRLKDQDRDKYLAIGESDRMTLKFRKPK